MVHLAKQSIYTKHTNIKPAHKQLIECTSDAIRYSCGKLMLKCVLTSSPLFKSETRKRTCWICYKFVLILKLTFFRSFSICSTSIEHNDTKSPVQVENKYLVLLKSCFLTSLSNKRSTCLCTSHKQMTSTDDVNSSRQVWHWAYPITSSF